MGDSYPPGVDKAQRDTNYIRARQMYKILEYNIKERKIKLNNPVLLSEIDEKGYVFLSKKGELKISPVLDASPTTGDLENIDRWEDYVIGPDMAPETPGYTDRNSLLADKFVELIKR